MRPVKARVGEMPVLAARKRVRNRYESSSLDGTD